MNPKMEGLFRELGGSLEELVTKLEEAQKMLEHFSAKISWKAYEKAGCPYGRSESGHKLWMDLFVKELPLDSRN
ncbi:MAG: hypothetical protein HZA17_05500 [Nitrospirae bacterium]|nr:hypothetical protein [Nitrospirota bacterium]